MKNNLGIKACLGLILTAVLIFGACQSAQKTETNAESLKIVSVGGSVTETVYALGAENLLVGTDSSSLYPEAARKLSQVGYQRQISAEGVLSLKPTHVLTMAEAGPPAAITQIESAGVKVIKVDGENSIDGIKKKIREIAAAVNLKDKGEELVKKLETDLESAKPCVESIKDKPKVLFIYARGSGAPNVSGRNTSADAMINLAGGQNAVTEFENFKPLTPEALVAAAPDFILFPSRGLGSVGGIEAVLNMPGVKDTPAGKNWKIIAVDDLVLLGFGPRTGQGVKELCEKIQQK